MHTKILIGTIATTAGLGALLGFGAPKTTPAPAPSSAPSAETLNFDIDGGHSSVIFKIQHLGVSNFYGRFNEVSGSFSFDPDDLATMQVEVTVNAESIDSNHDGRDDHLKGPDFFNVKQFPELTFTSTKAEPAGAKVWVHGELTMLDETREIKILMDNPMHSVVNARFGHRAGMECFFHVNRSDFGMNYMLDGGLLGNDVQLIISLEGIAK